MKYVQIPFVSQPVSRIVLGCAGGLFASGGDIAPVMEAALSCGINAVDTARVYGQSEETLGRWMQASGHRMILISKGCHPSLAFLDRVHEKAAREDLQRSLDALRTDHIDIYLLHRDHESSPVGPIVEFLNRFHEEGKIGAFGGSNWTAGRIAAANEYAKAHGLVGFTVSSPHYSLGRQRHDPWGNGCKTVTKDETERRFYRETRMPLLAWSSLCGGVFSGKLKAEDWGRLQKLFGLNARWAYGGADNRDRLARCEQMAAEKGATVAQIALSWLMSGEINTLPVISASGPDRVRENAAAADLTLTEEERTLLNGGSAG